MRKIVIAIAAVCAILFALVAVLPEPMWVLYSLRAQIYLWQFKPKYTGAECLIRIDINDAGPDITGFYDKLIGSFFRYQVVHEPGSIGFDSQIDRRSYYTMLRDDCDRRWEIAQGMIDNYIHDEGHYPRLSVARDPSIPVPQQMQGYSRKLWVDGEK